MRERERDLFTGQTLCHNTEADPGDDLVRVVRTGHKVEQLGQRVAVRNGDFPCPCSSWSHISKGNMDRKVAEFSNLQFKIKINI